MKRSALALAVALFSSGVMAESTLSIDLRDRYIADPALMIVDNRMQMVNLFTGFENGVYLDFWTAFEDNDERVEDDYTIGFGKQFGKTYVDISWNYWDTRGSTEFDTFAIAIDVTHQLSDAFAATLYVRPTFVKDSVYNGVQTRVGLSHTIEFGSRFSLTTEAGVGYDTSYDTGTWYTRVDIIPAYQLTENVTLRAGFTARDSQLLGSENVLTLVAMDARF